MGSPVAGRRLVGYSLGFIAGRHSKDVDPEEHCSGQHPYPPHRFADDLIVELEAGKGAPAFAIGRHVKAVY